MAIHHLSVSNYRVFREVEFDPLPPLAVVIGANGTGKSTLFDVFAFLKDALAGDVHSATAKRGGFRELVSRGRTGPIQIIIGYSVSGRDLSYRLTIEEQAGRAIISAEVISVDLPQKERILEFYRGRGIAERKIGRAHV